VSKFLEAAAKDVGSPINIAGFERFTLGEGVERREEDFADEVAKLTN
jgi:elongation factor Ts